MLTNRISAHLPPAPRCSLTTASPVPPGFTQLPHIPLAAVPQEMQDLYRWAYEQAQRDVQARTESAHLWN